MRAALLALLLGSLSGCQESHAVSQEPIPPSASARTEHPAPRVVAATKPKRPDGTRYPWLGAAGVPEPTDALSERFAPPPGFARMKLLPGGFGAWLRDLPLARAGTPVVTYSGSALYTPDDPRIAGVAAIDIGKADLQQCADAVIRLHAEWSWSAQRPNVSYRAAAGLDLPYQRWAGGERIRSRGASIEWVPGGASGRDHAGFRKYLDAVFAWANTVSLHKQARAVEPADVRPGDFFVLPGNPGHTVLVLDLAVRGRQKRALLGQSFMPAQSFQVLKPAPDAVWFELDPERDVTTPFWRPFPWTSLRRLDT